MLEVKSNYVRGADTQFTSINDHFDTPFEHALNSLRGKKGLILAAGGQAPGLNLVVKNLVDWSSKETEFYGLDGGFPGINDQQESISRLVTGNSVDIRKYTNDINSRFTPVAPKSDGTTLLLEMGRGSEGEADLRSLAAFLQSRNFDFLVSIGGNGTLAATTQVEQFLRNSGSPVQVIHIPKTVDGDLYGSTFGLLSAADYTREQIKRITSEHGINGTDPVVNLFEIMGRGSGKLALAVGEACRQVDLVIPPELPNSTQFIDERLNVALGKGKGMNIVIAEGVMHIDGLPTPIENERMVDCLEVYLQNRFGIKTQTRAKINKARWTYDLRAVGGLVGADERIINGMCDTAIRTLASGALGTSVIGTDEVLDITRPRPEADRFELKPETKKMLLRQGYSLADIRRSFLLNA